MADPNASPADDLDLEDDDPQAGASAPDASTGDSSDTPDDPTAGDDDYDVEEQEDGSAVVSLGDDEEDDEDEDSEDFTANLAESLDQSFLDELGSDLAEAIQVDRDSRKERDKQYAEGIKRTGLGDEAPGGADFDGASRAVHPMLAKGCVDFASKAIKELFPSTGPAKTQIIGTATDAKIDKAERKKAYMNWQLTCQIPEQRTEFERLLSQLPLGGSQYKRWWRDTKANRNRTETVYVDDVFLPFSQSDFYSSYRVTHRQWVSEPEYEQRIADGLYVDLDIAPSSMGSSDQSESKKATDAIEGNDDAGSIYNEEGLREIYLVYADIEVDGDKYTKGQTAPYIIHVENHTQRVIGLYRNWKESDNARQKLHWMVEYAFIPWRGAYAVGLPHLIGSLAGAGTGSLRALLDSAHIQNFPGGLKLKAGRTSGQSIQVNATELAEIDAPAGVDDIRKLVMAFPFNGPSNVLYQLLEWVTQQAESLIATASESIADAGANLPVGTALALIEHGSTNFSAIHARCHASFKREMEILHRLNAEYMDDQETIEELGELVVLRADFEGPVDIVPVSDPNIFSEAQRYAQVQALIQLMENPAFGQIFKADRVLKRALKVLQIPAPEELANLPKDPTIMGPIDENYTVCAPEPGPIKVYTQQDHLSHIKSHLTFLTSPMFGANPLVGPMAFGALMPHIKDHMVALYKIHANAASEAAAMIGHSMGKPMPREHAEMQGTAFADLALAKLMAPIMPVLQHAMQMAQQFQPKPPVNPDVQAQIAAQTAQSQATTQAQLQEAQQRNQAELQKLQQTQQFQAQQNALDRQAELQKHSMTLQADIQRDSMKSQQADKAMMLKNALDAHTQEMQRQLDQIRVASEEDRAKRENDALLQREQLKADNAANLAILNGIITQQQTAPQPDLAKVLQPLIESMNGTTQQMLQQLQTGLADVKNAVAAQPLPPAA